ncbi:Hypothetical predicted protein [Mytilus galloprovincialis]|uniref:Endonuclease/exonuclease/phosphatase domain-containing protein n=1 Tax=Mytilus galloprovincialis TaxID=29158 RepID=A0A8B6FYS5_MYTGA|nr:Hypothetical predicted protein [Mytilus galloprovincialis]
MHIISLVETWSDSGKPVDNIPGFDFICNSTRKKHKRARRGSGGISLYVRSSIYKGISKLTCTHNNAVWVKLDKHFFNLKNDIFMATVYFSPEYSSGCTEDINEVYSKLLRNIEHYSQLGDIVIQGDFNAYTNTIPDFVISDEAKFPKSKDNDYSIDSHNLRNNLDSKSANKSGKLLIDLCKESGLRILNGRTIGDPLGKCTCITYNGSSLVDYTLVSSNLLQCIGNFKVSDFTPISDHCLISCSLLACFQKCKNNTGTKLDPFPGKFVWDNKAIDCYTTNIQNSHVKQRLDEFVNDKQIDSNSAVEKIQRYFV